MTNTIKAEPKVRRILLAEDEESIRRSLKIVLRNAGYAVVEVDNGQAALDYLLHNRQR
jgi:CheY-like chemotaxis protein